MSHNWLDKDAAKGLAGTAGRADIPAMPGGTSAPDPFLGLKQAAEMASREIRGIPSKRYVIPEGMLEAFRQGMTERPGGLAMPRLKPTDDLERAGVEGVLRWLSENPIAPTMQQLQAIYDSPDCPKEGTYVPYYLCEWQRRMFLAPEPDVPEALIDLLAPKFTNALEVAMGKALTRNEEEYQKNILEAYRRGRKGI